MTLERNEIILAKALGGIPYAEIGREFAISKQRVHQIVHGEGKVPILKRPKPARACWTCLSSLPSGAKRYCGPECRKEAARQRERTTYRDQRQYVNARWVLRNAQTVNEAKVRWAIRVLTEKPQGLVGSRR